MSGQGRDTERTGTGLIANPEFAQPAADDRIRRTAAALEANNIQTLVVDTAGQAKDLVLGMLPKGAEVHQGASVTMQVTGLKDIIEKSGDYAAVRPRLFSMDRKTQADEMRELGARPAYMLGSVHAVTEDGYVLVASKTGSQLGPYASGAGRVIWVVGAQKLVRDFDEGMRRIREYNYPLEDEQSHQLYGVGTEINKILIVYKELRPGRITMIIVKEKIGF